MLLFLITCVCITEPLRGATTGRFLWGVTSARLSGMGGLCVGIADDTASSYLNPAGLDLLVRPEINLSLWNGFLPGSSYQFAGFSLPAKGSSWSFSYLGYTAGKEEIYEFDGSQRTVELEKDNVFGLGWGKYLWETFVMGSNLKLVTSTLGGKYKTKAVEIDLGLLYRGLKDRFSFGVGIENLTGSKMKYKDYVNSLPSILKFGVAYRLKFTALHQILFGGDLLLLEKEKVGDRVERRIGLEYYPGIPFLTGRAGLSNEGGRTKFSAGLGFSLPNYQFDYAFRPGDEIAENSHRFSLSLKWGPLKPLEVGKFYAEKGLAKKAIATWEEIGTRDEDYQLAQESIAKLKAELSASKPVPPAPASEEVPKPVEVPKPPLGKKMLIAVADLEGHNVSAMEAATIADFLRTELINSGAFVVLERSNMAKVLAEQRFQQTGCTTTECAVQMGKILNVEKMVVGSFSKLVSIYFINVRLVDVESGVSLVAESIECETERELYKKVKELTKGIVAKVSP